MEPITEFEQQLSRLPVTAPRLNAEQTVYRAGYAAGRRTLRIWQAANACCVILLAVCWILAQHRPSNSVPAAPLPGVTALTHADSQQPHAPIPTADASASVLNEHVRPFSYLALRELALDGEFDKLPESNGSQPPYRLRSRPL